MEASDTVGPTLAPVLLSLTLEVAFRKSLREEGWLPLCSAVFCLQGQGVGRVECGRADTAATKERRWGVLVSVASGSLGFPMHTPHPLSLRHPPHRGPGRGLPMHIPHPPILPTTVASGSLGMCTGVH